MPGQLPLSALLSQVLVAFTIECDNEFEHRMPHRTSNHGRAGGRDKVLWLVSMAMWSTCLRFVGPEGMTVGQLQVLARTGTNLPGMQRWGYIDLVPDPAGTRPRPPQSGWVIRATPKGRRAQEVQQPLTGEIEERWRERFGAARSPSICETQKEGWEARFGASKVAAVREPLERLAGEPGTSPLWRGLEPYPDGWRAKVRKPTTLPHYPMVLHRGGFPDGS